METTSRNLDPFGCRAGPWTTKSWSWVNGYDLRNSWALDDGANVVNQLPEKPVTYHKRGAPVEGQSKGQLIQ